MNPSLVFIAGVLLGILIGAISTLAVAAIIAVHEISKHDIL